jgi:hypothetical protein
LPVEAAGTLEGFAVYNFIYRGVVEKTENADKSLRRLVDVTGIEPATPCLQSKLENAMWLSRLAFTYVVLPGFQPCSAGFVPKVVPKF